MTTVSDCRRAALCAYELPQDTFSHGRRYRKVVRARFTAINLARRLTGASYVAIARKVGVSDHTTAIHGFRRAIELLASDQDFLARMRRAEALLGVDGGYNAPDWIAPGVTDAGGR